MPRHIDPANLTVEDVQDMLDSMFRRCEAARSAGGIALQDVVDEKATVPEGWELDPTTNYFIPGNVKLI